VPEPTDFYRLVGNVPDLSGAPLLVALTGFVDAGGATRMVAGHLLATRNPTVVASFDVDLLLDYRSRRPGMLFSEDHWESYAEPRLDLHLLTDESGSPFLLLAGPEPDLYWERFTAAVRGLVVRFGVRLTVVVTAIPMAVPHTRPTGITAHATRRELIAGYVPWLQRVQVPGSAAHLLEFQLGRDGRDAVGFAVHVPHYVAQVDYPAAAETLLGAVSRLTSLQLPTAELGGLAASVKARLDEETAASAEVAAAVRSLEEQYDAYLLSGRGPGAGGRLPTAEELGAEAERWLAEQPPGEGGGPQ
jgi:hypothetical protein